MDRQKAIILIEKKITFLNNQEDSLHSDVAQLQTLLDDLEETYEGSDEEKEILEVIDAGQFDLEIPTPKLNNKKTKSTKNLTCEVCKKFPAEFQKFNDPSIKICKDCLKDNYKTPFLNWIDLYYNASSFLFETSVNILEECWNDYIKWNFTKINKEESHE